MSKIDNFKKFVSLHPEFVDYVKNNKVSWQTFYELYDLYGEDMSIWNKYITNSSESANVKGLINSLRNINLDSLEENINSIQKAVGLISEFTKPNSEEESNSIVKEEKIDKLYGEDNGI